MIFAQIALSIALASSAPNEPFDANILVRAGTFYVDTSEINAAAPNAQAQFEKLFNEISAAAGAVKQGLHERDPIRGQLERIKARCAAAAFEATEFAGAPPSEAELIDYFRSTSDRVTIRQIQSHSREATTQARTRIVGGEDFDAVARELDVSGGRPPRTMTLSSFPEDIRAALTTIPLNTVSEVLDLQVGFSVVEVTDRVIADIVNLTDAKRADLTKHIAKQRQRALRSHYLTKRRQVLGIKINRQVLEQSGVRVDAPELASSVLATVGNDVVTYGDLVVALRQTFKRLTESTHMSGMAVKLQFSNKLVEQLILENDALTAGFGDSLAARRLCQGTERRLLAGALYRSTTARPGAIGDDDIKAYYDNSKLDFRPDRIYHLSHILCKTRADAERILATLRDGASFGEIANTESIDSASAVDGGNLPPLSAGRLRAIGIEPAIKIPYLRAGELSQVLESPFGFHLMRLRKVDIAPPISFVDAQNSARERLRANRVQTVWAAELNSLRAAQNTQINHAALKTMHLSMPNGAEPEPRSTQ